MDYVQDTRSPTPSIAKDAIYFLRIEHAQAQARSNFRVEDIINSQPAAFNGGEFLIPLFAQPGGNAKYYRAMVHIPWTPRSMVFHADDLAEQEVDMETWKQLVFPRLRTTVAPMPRPVQPLMPPRPTQQSHTQQPRTQQASQATQQPAQPPPQIGEASRTQQASQTVQQPTQPTSQSTEVPRPQRRGRLARFIQGVKPRFRRS